MNPQCASRERKLGGFEQIRNLRPVHFLELVTEDNGVESSLPTAAEYKQLQSALVGEWQLHWISVLRSRASCRILAPQAVHAQSKGVGIAIMDAFQKQLLDTRIYFVGTGQSFPLIELLRKQARPSFDFDVT